MDLPITVIAQQGDGLVDFLLETVELGLAAVEQSVVAGRRSRMAATRGAERCLCSFK